MADAEILYELRNGIGYLTLNRPQAANAFNKEMVRNLSGMLLDCKEDQACRALIVTGAGGKIFGAGADITTFMEERDKPQGCREWSRYGQAALRLIEGLGKPSIAAINGLAAGGGLEFALACTFRIASRNARFGFPEINLGFIPGWGGTQRAARLLGKAKTLELMLTGDLVDAGRALAIGLVDSVVEPEELMKACEDLAARIVRHSPIAVKICMEAVHVGSYLSLDEGLAFESTLAGWACESEDAREGLSAFLEKRKPIFKGK